MSEGKIVRVRNVNEGLRVLRDSRPQEDLLNWRRVSPRGMLTYEYRGTYVTEYTHPNERVLFSPERDANPFFHFFEALWILAGRRDVAFLKQFVSTMDRFSDDGITFHAAYGHRLRHHWPVDQITLLIRHLRHDPDSRRAVLCLWDPALDLDVDSKDIPCNDMVMFKLRENVLDMTVCCRSNDAIWGAYGANAVQFSMLQELVARTLSAEIGVYRQVSDSFHIYDSNEAWVRLTREVNEVGEEVPAPPINDLYRVMPDMVPFPIMRNGASPESWFAELARFMNFADGVDTFDVGSEFGFFEHVALPMWTAWRMYKNGKGGKTRAVENACAILADQCCAPDWSLATVNWMRRRDVK